MISYSNTFMFVQWLHLPHLCPAEFQKHPLAKWQLSGLFYKIQRKIISFSKKPFNNAQLKLAARDPAIPVKNPRWCPTVHRIKSRPMLYNGLQHITLLKLCQPSSPHLALSPALQPLWPSVSWTHSAESLLKPSHLPSQTALSPNLHRADSSPHTRSLQSAPNKALLMALTRSSPPLHFLSHYPQFPLSTSHYLTLFICISTLKCELQEISDYVHFLHCWILST